MDRPHGYGAYEEDKHNVAAGQQSSEDQGQLYRDDPQQQHEKKSVLRKVKDKAKKLKDNITHKHGHDQDQDQDQDHDTQAENEGYEDEDEEMEDDPEIHGAPIYDSHQSATSQGSLPSHTGQGTTQDPPTTNVSTGLATVLDPEEASQQQHSSGALPGIEAPKTTEEHISAPRNTAPSPKAAAGAGDDAPAGGYYTARTSSLTQTQNPGQGANPSARLGAALETPHTLEEDPRGPGRVHEPENYQSKVTDPTGMDGEEIGVTAANPVLQSLDKMKIYDEPPEQGTGSHNQFSPEPIPSGETNPSLQNPQDKGTQFTDAGSKKESTCGISKTEILCQKINLEHSRPAIDILPKHSTGK